MPYVVGLTGGIGSGKSTVAKMFGDLGAATLSADQLARDTVRPGTEALARIADHFGDDILSPDGTLDRKTLRQHIFKDDAARMWLENLLHPLIADERNRQIASTKAPYVIVEIPLLLEKQLAAEVDRVLVVDASEKLQISRVQQRDGVDADSVLAIMGTQVNSSHRRASADDVIDNNGTLDDLKGQVASLHQRYLALAAQAV